MDVPVRSHLSPLSDDQVARIRARWEREKRARVAAPPAATRRRRGAATAAPSAEAKPEPAPAEAPAVADVAPPVSANPVAAPPVTIAASMPADAPTIERLRTPAAPARP